MAQKHNRRTAVKSVLASAAAVTTTGLLTSFSSKNQSEAYKPKGNINHSVCRWCLNDLSVEEVCKAAKDLGMVGVDLVGPSDWPILQKYGLVSTMCNGAEIGLSEGWNDPKHHAVLIKNYTDMIPMVAKAGYQNLICFSGNRNGKDDETGLRNCVEGLKQIMPLAEKHNVVLVMELLNSKVNHPDYQCNHTKWGAELAKRLGSDNFKLLYDIYHMQIDEGDVIRTIQEYHPYIAHYHTAGVPGRREIDHTQELNYPAIMKAILATGFKGYVAHEFLPAHKDKIASFRQAVQICDV
ncbi:hydroxypyruvate isomerase family protein [Pontibacter harenae]|uniref:hydroxypyruvate isomerase family protein n=1 Tax=Pontibacter harenae TaxID=2894083 RepID=UPI001E40C087|nr:TIM barrel protein [Pontibacter harenae]MCC9165513.1 TIM barrel protein [Pontibacter harenae]